VNQSGNTARNAIGVKLFQPLHNGHGGIAKSSGTKINRELSEPARLIVAARDSNGGLGHGE
jgi:hypothetical protein